MSPLSRLRRRFHHHAWATSVLTDAVLASATPSAVRVLAHALAADRVWWCRLTGTAVDTEIWPAPDAVDLGARAAQTASCWDGYLGGADLDGVVAYQNSRGVAFETSVADVLDHVLLHAAHHRGQANAALRASGAVPPPLDFITWGPRSH